MNIRETLLRPAVARGLMAVVALFVLVGLTGFLAAPHFLRPFLEQALSEKLHRPVKVAELALNPYALSVTVRGLSVGEREGPGELAGFDELYANLETSSLVRLAPVLKELRLVGPRVHLVRMPDKRYNVSDLIEEFLARPDEPPSRYAIYNIRVSGGRIVFDDRPEKRSHEVRDLALGIPFVSNLPSQVEVYVEPALSGRLNGAAFSLGGRARPFAETREAALELAVDDLDLRPYLDYVPLGLRFRLASARLDSRLRVVLSQPSGKPASLALSGSAALRQVALRGTDGKPVLDLAALKVALRSADLSGKVVLDSLALEGPELHVARLKDGSLSLEHLLARSAPAHRSAPAPTPGTGPLPDISLAEFRLSGGKFAYGDETVAKGTVLAVDGLEARLAGLRLAGGELKGGGDLAAALASLTLSGRGDKIPVFSLGASSLKGRLDGDRRELALSEFVAKAGRLEAAREPDGSLNLEKFLPQPAGKPASGGRGNAPAGAAAKPWRVTLANLALDGWGARFFDPAVPVPLVVRPIRFRAENLSTAGGKAKLDLSAGLGRKGSLAARGTLALAPLSGVFDLELKGLDLVPLQGYALGGFNLSLARGALDGKGSLRFERAGTAPLRAGFKGSLGLSDLGLVDKGNASDLLKWRRLSLTGVSAGLGGKPAFDLSLSEIALKDFFARLVVNPDGTLALRTLLKHEEAAATGQGAGGRQESPSRAPTPAPVPAPAPAVAAASPAAGVAPPDWRVRVGRVSLSGGQVRFSDLFVKPNYSANLTGLSGTVQGLSSAAGSTAEVAVSGTVDGTAPLSISGRVNPLARELFLDLTADARGIEMSGFSPYSARYAGYGIEKGKLSANIHYFIEKRQLKAENHLFLDQLTFGQRVESPQATHLPVLLAVALLKNSRGEIDINLPISGSLDDPQFSVGGIVVKMFVNLIVKAVTAPFALIGSLFGGGEELAWLEFDPGRAAISPANMDKLQKLARALKDRPGLRLEVAGRADAAADGEGFRRRQLERKVKAQKLKETVKKGEGSSSVDDVAVAKEEWPRYLALAYKAEDFKKPKNLLFLPKSLPPEEMERLMLANIPVSDETLRRLAEQRAQAAAEWLIRAGVPAERVFVVAPRLGADPPREGKEPVKARLSRADFVLK